MAYGSFLFFDMNKTRQKTLNLTLIQPDIVWEDPKANIEQYANVLQLLPPDTDIVIFPEAFNTGFSMNAKNVSELMSGKSVEWLRKMAQKHQMTLCGSLFISEDNKYYNRFVWIEPSGRILHYDKRHLFSIANENEHYSNGSKQLIIDYKGWKIFPQICYDLRFPVWSRNTSEYDLMINVANWPAARNKVWDTLLKARAIENQCYVAAVNRVGADGKNIQYTGNSMLIDYKGNVINNYKQQQGWLNCSIDYDALYEFREKFNTLIDADNFKLVHRI